MKQTAYTCMACSRTLPVAQYSLARLHAGQHDLCIHCEAMVPYDLAHLVFATVTRDVTFALATGAGAREARRLKRLERYASTGKRCSDCHEYKPVDAYDISKRKSDGLQSSCRHCMKLYISLRKQGGLTLWHTVRQALRDKAAAKDKPI